MFYIEWIYKNINVPAEFKTADLEDPLNYRLILLTTALAKIFESPIKKQFDEYVHKMPCFLKHSLVSEKSFLQQMRSFI